MKKFVAIAAIGAVSISLATAGGEIPAPPVAPPPAPYYVPAPPVAFAPEAAPPQPSYLTKVGNDGSDVLFTGGDFLKQTVDFTVGVVTLGFVDVSKDDIR